MNILELTPENYKVPKGEERSYHCVIECVEFDRKTGKRLSVPRIQKFGAKMFEAHVYSSLKKQGYNVTILHDPKKWLKEHEAEQKAQAKAKEAAEKEAFQKAVQEEVARQMAALQSNAGQPAGQPAGQSATQEAPKNKGGRPKKEQK